jgi:hypothetical protein
MSDKEVLDNKIFNPWNFILKMKIVFRELKEPVINLQKIICQLSV